MSEVALILAGHGSHVSPTTAGLVWGYVDRLRLLGVAAEITACFWKEPPSYSQVIHTVASQNVVVVPVFTAQGYFADDVLPSEMGLDGPLTVARPQANPSHANDRRTRLSRDHRRDAPARGA